MNRLTLIFFITGGMLLAADAGAKEINLNIGESYRQGDLTITCGQSSLPENPLSITDCQFWDDFKEKCLFEKKTYVYKNIECVEDCQHWDAFSGVCHYRTKCTFYPVHKSFIRTTCEKFDDFNNTCLKTRDTKIGR